MGFGETSALSMDPVLAGAVAEDRVVSFLPTSCFFNNFGGQGHTVCFPGLDVDGPVGDSMDGRP